MAIIHSIYRYPVKGLSPEALPRIALAPGETVPGDRLYAIENGPSGFDPSAPAYLSKQHFLMLMKNERLAALRTAFDQASHVLRIQDGESEAARGDLRTEKGRGASKTSSPPLLPTSCMERRKSCTPTATAFPTSPAR